MVVSGRISVSSPWRRMNPAAPHRTPAPIASVLVVEQDAHHDELWENVLASISWLIVLIRVSAHHPGSPASAFSMPRLRPVAVPELLGVHVPMS